MEAPRTLGQRLEAWRLAEGTDQREAAAALGVSRWTYGCWERDQKQPAIRFMPSVLGLVGRESCERSGSLAQRLQMARRVLGLSQESLADRLGVDRGTLGAWERGVRVPQGKRLDLVEAFLDDALSQR